MARRGTCNRNQQGALLTVNGNGAGPQAGTAKSHRAVSPRGAWRLAGLLFIVGALSTIPGTLLLEKDTEPWMYWLPALAVAIGTACLVLPSDRLTERWLVVIPPLATILATITVAATDDVYSFLFFFIALFIGLVFPAPGRMAPFLVLMLAGLLAPLAYSDEPTSQALLWAIGAGPGFVLTALVVGRLTAGLEESRDAYRQLSSEDGLTGVGNYRSLMERLRHEASRHERRDREFAVLSLDLDDFKGVNETQGHLVGDLVLAMVGSMVDLEVRAEDAVFRQGGDEFSVIAPETGYKEARNLVQRIEESVSRVSTGDTRISASVGCAVFPRDGTHPSQLLDAADADLHARKRGAPRVRVSPPQEMKVIEAEQEIREIAS